MDADDVEAVEQVFLKLAVGDPFLQILVGGGDDPHVHLHRLAAADPVELAVRQHPQQPGLQRPAACRLFRREQGAAVGLLEAAVADVVGAGEGPLVAEQLGFDEILGNGRHVEGDEVLVGPGLCLCRAWATSSLPVPLWPLISTEMLERDSRPMAREYPCMAGLHR